MRLGKSARANPVPARKTSAAKPSEPLTPSRLRHSRPRAARRICQARSAFSRTMASPSCVWQMPWETARRQGVTADRVLIAEGQISEDYFYRALARHLRLTFIDADVALKAAAPYPQMIEAGAVALAPGQGAAFLTAPRGHGDRPFDRRLEPAWAGVPISLLRHRHTCHDSFAKLRAATSRAPRALTFATSTPIFAPGAV